MSILIVVVLPAPFGPRRPKSSPGRTSKLTPRTASTEIGRRRTTPVCVLYVRARSIASMAGVFVEGRSMGPTILAPGGEGQNQSRALKKIAAPTIAASISPSANG